MVNSLRETLCRLCAPLCHNIKIAIPQSFTKEIKDSQRLIPGNKSTKSVLKYV